MEIRVVSVNVSDIVIPPIRIKSIPSNELIQSLKEAGLMEPIIVCFDEDGLIEKGKYILIDGEQRLNCIKQIGLNEVKVRVVGKCMWKLIYVLNITFSTRGEIDKLSLLRTLLHLRRELKWSITKIAQFTGYDPSYISKLISIAEEIDREKLWDKLPHDKSLRWYLERIWVRELSCEHVQNSISNLKNISISELATKIAKSGDTQRLITEKNIELIKSPALNLYDNTIRYVKRMIERLRRYVNEGALDKKKAIELLKRIRDDLLKEFEIMIQEFERS